MTFYEISFSLERYFVSDFNERGCKRVLCEREGLIKRIKRDKLVVINSRMTKYFY